MHLQEKKSPQAAQLQPAFAEAVAVDHARVNRLRTMSYPDTVRSRKAMHTCTGISIVLVSTKSCLVHQFYNNILLKMTRAVNLVTGCNEHRWTSGEKRGAGPDSAQYHLHRDTSTLKSGS